MLREVGTYWSQLEQRVAAVEGVERGWDLLVPHRTKGGSCRGC